MKLAARQGLIMGAWSGCTSRVEHVETGMHADFVDDAVRTLRAAAPGDLARVREAAAVVAHGDHLLVGVVRQAREAGRSWAEIAAALGVSTAAVRDRWSDPRRPAGRAAGAALSPLVGRSEPVGRAAALLGAVVPACGRDVGDVDAITGGGGGGAGSGEGVVQCVVEQVLVEGLDH